VGPTPVPQIKAKYNSLLVDLFRETFCWLPLAHLLSNKVLLAKMDSSLALKCMVTSSNASSPG
jgi:hypothetical protein